MPVYNLLMEDEKSTGSGKANADLLKSFIVHLIVFAAVNLLLLFVPVIFNGKAVFDFEGREALFYGSAGWAVGLLIHGIAVLVYRIIKRAG